MADKPLILLIEDELSIAKIIEFKLTRNNFRFEHRDNGKYGLDAVYELNPDIVILDVMLPTMNGFEVLRRIREDEEIKDTKVIMLTSKARVEDIKAGFDLAANDYMEKPFKPDELIMRIRRILN